MFEFTLYAAHCIGGNKNCRYPLKCRITGEQSLSAAVSRDHVSAKYVDSYRKNENFLVSDNVPLDCDNSHTENPEDWITPLDVALAFPDVCFAVAYSRNHMKPKDGTAARPRFHVYFPIPAISDAQEYALLKKQIIAEFKYFDVNAADSARFFFGVKNATVEIYNGNRTIKDYLVDDDFEAWDAAREEIHEGSRNSTMSHIAGRLIKRYGNTDESFHEFLKRAEKCNPPLPDSELKAIWNSAVKFGVKVSSQEGYIPPEQYNSESLLKPTDFSDVGQAVVLAREYKDRLRYSPATDYLVFNGSFWEESGPKSQGLSQELTERQLDEAETEMQKAMNEMLKNGAMEIIANVGPKRAANSFNSRQARAFEMYQSALEYKKYAIKRRDTKNITSALKEARPMLEIEQQHLDAGEFLLNTPSAVYDLRKGTESPSEHNALDFITKQTAVDPGTEGGEIWETALNTFFQNDESLIEYVQKIVGLSAIGKVYIEALIIAYGEGRNGKSTFWNTVSRVMGTYSGNISADMLTVGCRRNVKPELAEAKGKRLLIAAELEEGMRLNTSNVKQLCSTDEIYAEKKYKDPFAYVPTHTLVLYTNHLPRVGALDEGTWRRLIIIPFNASISGKKDVKNYADYLFNNAGGAIMTWIIEGAKKVITDNFHIDPPQKVLDAIKVYREDNDWLRHFLDECCEIDPSYTAKSGEFYSEYRAFCARSGEFARGTADFYSAIDGAGFTRKKLNTGMFIKGVRIKSEFPD